MLKHLFLILFFIGFTGPFSSGIALGQKTIKVIAETTLRPISDVYIFNNSRNKVVSTNVEGKAILTKFAAEDTLHFQHPSFKPRVIIFHQLKGDSPTISLVERPVVMDEIFVSANKREQKLEEIPQRIKRIPMDDIQFQNPQTSADLLQSSGNVFVQKSQLGGGSPMIRGFAANSVLIAVDGIRINNAIFRSGNLQNVISVDPNALESTEVLFGPGSIIYGSDALGGVMNFQTKQPVLSYSEEQSLLKVNGLARYSSANNERTFHADLSYGKQQWGFLSSVSYSYFDDLRSGGNFYDEFPTFGKREEYVVRQSGEDTVVENDDVTMQRHSGYQQLNLMQKIRYKPTGSWDLSYGLHYATTTDIPRYDRLIERSEGDAGSLVNAEWYYGPQIWMLNTIKADHFADTGLYDKMSAVISQQWFQESRNDRDFGSPTLRNREENIDVYTANVDFDKQWGTSRELFYGLEGIHSYVTSEAMATQMETGRKSPVATRYPDEGSGYTQLAAYAKYKQDLFSNLTAVAGTRYSHVMLDARFSDQFYDFPFDDIDLNTGAFSGSLGFTYRPAKTLQFNLNGSTGFRAPNIDDVAKVFDSEPGTVIVPNANLKPEYSYNVDFSVIKDFNEQLRLELNTYYTWLRDAMVRRNFQFNGQDSIQYDGTQSKVEALVNAGRAYIYGVSADLSAELSPHVAFDSQLTYTRGQDTSNDEPLRHVAPLFGAAGITYKAKQIKVEAYTEFNGKKDIDLFSPSERNKPHLYTPEGTPAWATLNMKASYQVNEEVMINAGIENILDKHYRPYSSGISAAGRNISVALRAQL
ncbi:TonB-dependent receptor [Fodinibius salsisoli]|uniref:TonB-dependent receptor n=1 Tax=Fodinibius salsisoli TaxID=2820877 RepID=A0ABT3PHL7_9BACT|nr:TonB-dependent receptor [Fodinibius salsisoli]MCW9705248.1 TonB-dependent receptor [Fodinibius salsisoli]